MVGAHYVGDREKSQSHIGSLLKRLGIRADFRYSQPKQCLRKGAVLVKNIHVQAQKDHITSLCTASPIQALAELIWNALDADAFDVKVDVIQNALGGIDAIRVADDGQGINALEADQHFGNLGGSWKRDVNRTPLGARAARQQGQGTLQGVRARQPGRVADHAGGWRRSAFLRAGGLGQ